jgi:hypothetical protein
LLIHVDDLLVTCESVAAIDQLGEQLKEEFGEITIQTDDDISYLDNVLNEHPVKGTVSTPANSNLAKRTRPDILLPISFLCTRVKEPTGSKRLRRRGICKPPGREVAHWAGGAGRGRCGPL